MTIVALVLSLAIAAVGAVGVASPPRLLGLARRLQTPAGLYVAAAIRVVLGIALFFAAPVSRAPELLRILGVFIILVGLITPLFGLERFRRVLAWWSERSAAWLRAWAAFALAFGLLLAYAVLP